MKSIILALALRFLALFGRRIVGARALLPEPDPRFTGRLYTGGFKPDDLARMSMPGVLLVRPVQPPQKVGGLFVPSSAQAMPGTMTMVHQVVQAGPKCKRFARGDVVVCRLSHLDPLDAQTGILAIEEKHVYSPVDDSVAAIIELDDRRRKVS